MMKPTAILVNTARGRWWTRTRWRRRCSRLDRRRGARRVREGAAAGGQPAARRAAEAEAAALSHFASAGRATRLSPIRTSAWRPLRAGGHRPLEGAYGGDPKQMPFVVNKEAF
jgi:hypothetical protein